MGTASSKVKKRVDHKNEDVTTTPTATGITTAVPASTTASIISGLEVPIYFINFKSLLARETFPRYPENKDLAVDVGEIDTSQSFLVFVSHCWARGWPGAEGWDGRPHPDDMRHAKMALCKKGIQKLWNELAPKCSNCYVWLDFGCINQDGSPCAELKQLDKIIQFCDCVFTPIVEDEDDIKQHKTDQLGINESSHDGEEHQDEIAKHYHSRRWSGDEHAYLNRGWTRVEMFYASAIPFLSTKGGGGEEISVKTSQFKAGLHSAVSKGRRPQFVYGTYQMQSHLPMRVLPPLLHSYFHRYHPMNGNLSVAEDRLKIIQLVEELMPFLKFAVESYEGGHNSDGQKEGFGKCTYANGDVYEGEFLNDQKLGTGTYHYSDGSSYKGDWKGDTENGFGTFTYACGDVYTGAMMDGQFHGQGEIVSVRGRRLHGLFERDRFVGERRQHSLVNELEKEGEGMGPRFDRQLSTCFVPTEDAMMGFDRDLSCSSGGSGGSGDFDARLSVASYEGY